MLKEGGSFANCKTELIPAIACVNVNAKNLGCTPTMEITKQETKTIEETHNAGETTTISRLRGTRNSFEGNHVNGFTKIDSHKFGGTIGLPTGSVSLFGLVTASGPKFEFRYDYTKETQQNYQYSATTVEEVSQQIGDKDCRRTISIKVSIRLYLVNGEKLQKNKNLFPLLTNSFYVNVRNMPKFQNRRNIRDCF